MNRMIIDTDPGEDDVMAMMMAFEHPEWHIEAITVAAGNVGLDHTTNNVGVMLDLLQLDIPVYAGCHQALVKNSHDASYAHGLDGLGNTGYKSSRVLEQNHAALELIARATASPGELTLVALAPLTNIATALKIDPELPYKFKRVVAMAGAVTGQGNVNRCTEFNVFADPEAAHVVFEAWGEAGKSIEVVDWELTTRNGFSKETRAIWWALDTVKSNFFAAISEHSNRFIETVRGRTIQFFADPVAMAVALEPSIIREAEKHHLAIELNGGQTRGLTVVDWLDVEKRPSNANIILEIDNERMHQLVLNGLE